MRIFWQSKGIVHKIIIAVCLTFALTLSMVTPALAITDGATGTSPYVTITAVGVGSSYVELGLNVRSQDSGFGSVGAVVSYDPALLTPITWEETPTAIEVTTLPADTDTYTEEEARGHWNSTAVALDTKGPDSLSGKKVLAYNKTLSDTETAGYLYLMAEAPKLLPNWNQALPTLTDTKVGDTQNGVPYFNPKDEAKLETPVEQSVVVKFKLKSGTLETAINSFDLAIGTVSKGSPIYDDSGVAYFHNNKGESLPANVQILRAYSGTSYFTGGVGGGGVNMDGILSVAFYDWDETLLGILAVPAEEDISERVNTFVRRFIHPDLNDTQEEGETPPVEADVKAMMASNLRTDTYRGKHPSTYNDENTIDPTGSSYPLTNKLDYVFYKGDTTAEDYDGYYFAHGWIPVTTETLDGRAENGVFTAYESVDAAIAATPVDFSAGLTDSIMVKAAYVPGKDLKYQAGSNNYTITNVDYDRYGTVTATTGSYSMTATIERINSDGYGVTRLRSPAFRMQINTAAIGDNPQNIAVRVDLEGKDEASGEIVAPKLSSQTTFGFINSSAENWLGESLKAEPLTIPKDPDPDEGWEHGYLIMCTLKALNTAIRDFCTGAITQAEYGTTINETSYNDLGFDIRNGAIGGNNIQRIAIARRKMECAYYASCGQEMSYEFVKGVMFMSLDDNINNATNYNNAITAVKTAVAANGNQPLTVEQVEYAINNGGALYTGGSAE